MADPIRPGLPANGPDGRNARVGLESAGLAGAEASVLAVRASGAVCAIPAAQVIETMRPLPIEPLANLPNFVRGVALIRGAAVPIVDLGAVLEASGEPAMPPSQTARFVTLRVGERCVALAVESIIGLVPLNPEGFSAMPPLLNHARRDVIQAIGTLDAELLLVLETARLVPESVWGEVDKAQVAAR